MSVLSDAEREAMDEACERTHPHAVIERLCFNSGWKAARDYYKAEQQAESAPNAMFALLGSAHRVRRGEWIRGAATHVLAELLTDLEEHGWKLVNERRLEEMVQKPRLEGK